MGVQFGAVSFKDYTGTGGTMSHTPAAGTGAMAVLIASNLSTADVITSVAWGGGTLTRVAFISGGAASEPGASYLYFRGTVVASSGTVNIVSTNGTYCAWAISATANPSSECGIAGTATVTSTSLANPSGTVTGLAAGQVGLAVGVLFSGANAPASNAINTPYTAATASASGGADFGTESACAGYGIIDAPVTSFALGWANSTADDVAAIVALIRETPPVVLPPTVNFTLDVN